MCAPTHYGLCFYCLGHIKFQAGIGNGSISFCGMSMDWNDVLADYEGKFSYITVLTLKWQQNLEECRFYSWLVKVSEDPSNI